MVMQSHGGTCATLPANKRDKHVFQHHMINHNQIISMTTTSQFPWQSQLFPTRLPVIVTRHKYVSRLHCVDHMTKWDEIRQLPNCDHTNKFQNGSKTNSHGDDVHVTSWPKRQNQLQYNELNDYDSYQPKKYNKWPHKQISNFKMGQKQIYMETWGHYQLTKERKLFFNLTVVCITWPI